MNKITHEAGVYLLRFADGSYYIGQTNDLSNRRREHRARIPSGLSSKRLTAAYDSNQQQLPTFIILEIEPDDYERGRLEAAHLMVLQEDTTALCLNTVPLNFS